MPFATDRTLEHCPDPQDGFEGATSWQGQSIKSGGRGANGRDRNPRKKFKICIYWEVNKEKKCSAVADMETVWPQ